MTSSPDEVIQTQLLLFDWNCSSSNEGIRGEGQVLTKAMVFPCQAHDLVAKAQLV